MIDADRADPYYPGNDECLISFVMPYDEFVNRFGPAHRQMDARDEEPGRCEYWAFRFSCGLSTFLVYHFDRPGAPACLVYADRPEVDHVAEHLHVADRIEWRLDDAHPDLFRQRHGQSASRSCSDVSGREPPGMPVSWQMCRKDFEPDGSLRDVYVFDCDLETWRRVLSLLLATSDAVRHRIAGGEELPAVSSAEQLLPYLTVGNPTHVIVAFWRDGIEYVCHFFGMEEVELDFEPAAIDGPRALGSLVRLVGALGRATGRDVSVTPENGRDHPILTYSPAAGEVVLVGRKSQ